MRRLSCALLVLVLGASTVLWPSSVTAADFPERPADVNGHYWLQMEPQEKEAFVDSYRLGVLVVARWLGQLGNPSRETVGVMRYLILVLELPVGRLVEAADRFYSSGGDLGVSVMEVIHEFARGFQKQEPRTQRS